LPGSDLGREAKLTLNSH